MSNIPADVQRRHALLLLAKYGRPESLSETLPRAEEIHSGFTDAEIWKRANERGFSGSRMMAFYLAAAELEREWQAANPPKQGLAARVLKRIWGGK